MGWRSVLHLVRVAVTHSALGEGVVGKTPATIGRILHRNNAVGGSFALAVLSSVLSSRIQKQERGELVVLPFFVAKIGKYHKIEKNLSKLQRNFYPKALIQKYRIGIRDTEETYSRSRIRGQKDTGSRTRIRNTASVVTPVLHAFNRHRR